MTSLEALDVALVALKSRRRYVTQANPLATLDAAITTLTALRDLIADQVATTTLEASR